jgi:4-amino-4-deoxy-L-arabinose transferase-like glycosyltransferase
LAVSAAADSLRGLITSSRELFSHAEARMPAQVRQGLLLSVLATFVFLTGLGATHLWDDDETFFAEVAREMNERNDLVVPWFNQRLFAHKPPFMYWMMIGAYRVFGVTEFAARFPSVLFGLANVLLIWRLGRLLYSPRVGLWAAIILATNLNFAVIARAATSDAELTFFCTLALYCFVRGTAGIRPSSDPGCAPVRAWPPGELLNKPRWTTFAAMYAAMGLAVLVKGPIGVLLPTAVVGLFLLWNREPAGPRALAAETTAKAGVFGLIWSILRQTFSPGPIVRTIWSLRPLSALAAVLLVAGPWYLAVGWKTEGAFLKGFFGVHHFGRFMNPMDNHAGPVWYYLAAMCVGFFPWVIFLSPTIIQWYRRVRDRHDWRASDLLCAAWCVVWFGFFSLASTKFPHYVVPAYPALALMTAAFLDRWIASTEIYARIPRRGAWVTVGTAGVGIMVVVPILEQYIFEQPGYAGLTGLPLVAGAIAGAYYTERKRVTPALVGLTASGAAFLVTLFAFAAVEVDRHQNSDLLAAAIREHAGNERPRIGHFHYYRPGLTFYCREPIESQFGPLDAQNFIRGSSPRYLLTSAHEYEALKSELPADTEVLARYPWFLKKGRGVVLLGRKAPPESAPIARKNAENGADPPSVVK